MKRIDALIAEWAEDVVMRSYESGFPGINVIERILRDPGIATGGSKHKVLFWHRNKRIAMVSRAMHRIDPIAQICLIVRYGGILKEDGTVYTKHDLVKESSLTLRRFNELVRSSRKQLQEITRT